MTGYTHMILLKEFSKNDSISKEKILEIANRLIQDCEVENPPVNLEVLASFRDIKKIDWNANIQEAGMLCPIKGGGAEIYLRKSDSLKRKNFTCCHEISHTFFPDYQLKPQKRIDQETGEYQSENSTEFLCDLSASELLMPSFLFYPEMNLNGFSIQALKNLSDRFQASIEATAMKMVKNNINKTAFVIWEKKYKPSQESIKKQLSLPSLEEFRPEEELRVKYGFGFEGLGFIPMDKSIDEDGGLVLAAFKSGKLKTGKESIDFGNFQTKCTVQAFPLAYSNGVKILSLLSIT